MKYRVSINVSNVYGDRTDKKSISIDQEVSAGTYKQAVELALLELDQLEKLDYSDPPSNS